MALRVLLADESTTIKKVMQLALQDFAVEVKAVHAGVDVLDVARAFQPDIIFADVLLQKKNGYEVAASIKNDRELREVPVVLMWSSFMDLDEASARSCGAEARLEKPFDVETLRKLVLELVPKTRSQRLAHFLEFSPRLNAELIEDPAAQPGAGAAGAGAGAAATTPPPASAKAPAKPTVKPPPTRPPQQAPAQQPPQQTQPTRAQQTPQPTQAPPPTQARATTPPNQAPAQTAQAAPPAARAPSTSDLGARLAARAAAGVQRPAQSSAQSPAQSQGHAPGARKGPPPPDAFLKTRTAIPLDLDTDDAPDLTGDPAPTQAPPPQPAQPKSQWSMESFDDPSQYEEAEDFQPLELSQLAKDEPREEPLQTEPDGDDEAWARQDLSEFKLDLPPIQVGDGDLNIDMGEQEFTASNVKRPQAPPPAQFRTKEAPQLEDDESQYGNDLTLESEQINESEDEIALPLEPIDDSELELTTPPSQGLGQMSAAQLELVIRSQSREIIEQVVRKIVPDLAATIIREELERLLEDTAVREDRSL